MASWTAVRVLDWGRFWVWLVRDLLERLGRGKMRGEATIRTWRSENFFSSSRVRLASLSSCSPQRSRQESCLPLLGLVPALEERDGDEDDDSLTSVTNLDLRILVSANCAAQCPPPLRSKYGYGYGFAWRCASARCAVGGGLSYLAGRDKLQRAQRALQVGDIVLEVSQRLRKVSPAVACPLTVRNLRWRCWSQSPKGSASRGCWARSCSGRWQTCRRLARLVVGLSREKLLRTLRRSSQ